MKENKADKKNSSSTQGHKNSAFTSVSPKGAKNRLQGYRIPTKESDTSDRSRERSSGKASQDKGTESRSRKGSLSEDIPAKKYPKKTERYEQDTRGFKREDSKRSIQPKEKDEKSDMVNSMKAKDSEMRASRSKLTKSERTHETSRKSDHKSRSRSRSPASPRWSNKQNRDERRSSPRANSENDTRRRSHSPVSPKFKKDDRGKKRTVRSGETPKKEAPSDKPSGKQIGPPPKKTKANLPEIMETSEPSSKSTSASPDPINSTTSKPPSTKLSADIK